MHISFSSSYQVYEIYIHGMYICKVSAVILAQLQVAALKIGMCHVNYIFFRLLITDRMSHAALSTTPKANEHLLMPFNNETYKLLLSINNCSINNCRKQINPGHKQKWPRSHEVGTRKSHSRKRKTPPTCCQQTSLMT